MSAPAPDTEALPATRREYIRLCKDNGEITIKRSDARQSGVCAEGLDRFITAAFGGRTEVPLRDLVPWIRRKHIHWPYVMRVADRALTRANVLPAGFSYRDREIGSPRKTRPNAF